MVVAAAVLAAATLAVPVLGRSSPAPPVASGPVAVAPNGTGDVDGLTPAMRRSVRLAIEAARADGVELRVASGWRSAAHQERLFAEAVAKYGSPQAARRWVLPPDESEHVQGEAVDVAPPAGADWLAVHGVRFGLCRRYANEPWHFERLAGALGSTCPPLEPHA